jgi:glucose-6-phosphate 1-dehydrogenase
MEPPNSFNADDVRDEKVKLLHAIRPLSEQEVEKRVVRGQYAAGRMGNESVRSYLEEKNVRPDSRTETFVAARFEIDNWRWAGVPFYVRTGKRMASRLTEIVIQFHCAPFQLFRESDSGKLCSNLLVFQIQPDERIQVHFAAKTPGPGVHLGKAIMDFDYVSAFGAAPETGYETLLFDVMNGDATLFQRTDQIEVGWQVVMPILKAWEKARERGNPACPTYAPGSWGPEASNRLLADEGREWLAIGSPLVSPTDGAGSTVSKDAKAPRERAGDERKEVA